MVKGTSEAWDPERSEGPPCGSCGSGRVRRLKLRGQVPRLSGTGASAGGHPLLRRRESLRGSVQRKDLTPFSPSDPLERTSPVTTLQFLENVPGCLRFFRKKNSFG